MQPLWACEDYVEHLSHQNHVVRRWAFEAINERFPRRYTPEVAKLIGDGDEHLACATPKYLARHGAIDQAPAILESFRQGKGNVLSNCALALGETGYEPALDPILGRLAHCESPGTLFGILCHPGKIGREDCHQGLRDLFDQLSNHSSDDLAAECLLAHHNPEDVPLVLKAHFENEGQERLELVIVHPCGRG